MAFVLVQTYPEECSGTNGINIFSTLQQMVIMPRIRANANFAYSGYAYHELVFHMPNWLNLGNYSTAAGTSGTSGTTVGGGNYTWVG